MAGKYIVIGSQFDPFSYQELLAPVQKATTAHQEIESSLGDLSAKTSVWERLANETDDPEAYQMYKNYQNDLMAQATALSKNGLTPSSRSNLNTMYQRYNSEIAPLEQAYLKRERDIEQQKTARERDNTVLFDSLASESKLSDYIKNPSLTHKTISGADLTKRASSILNGLKDQLVRTGAWKSTAQGQLLERMTTKGIQLEDLQRMQQHPEEYPLITKALENLYETTGINQWKNPEAQQQALRYIDEGVLQGLGSSSVDSRSDASYLNPYETWKFNKEKEKAKTTPGQNNLFTYTGSTITTTNDETNKLNQAKALILKTQKLPQEQTSGNTRPLTTLDKIALYTDIATSATNPSKMIEQLDNNKVYKEVTKKYGTTDPQELLNKIDNELVKRAEVDKTAWYNANSTKLATSFLKTSLLAGIDLTSQEDVTTRIYKKEGNKKKPLSKDERQAVLNSEQYQMGWNPLTNEAQILTDKGTFIINKEAAFHNLGVLRLDGSIVPGDVYLNEIHDLYKNNYDPTNLQQKAGIDNLISNFMGAWNARVNSGMQEAPATNADASLTSYK